MARLREPEPEPEPEWVADFPPELRETVVEDWVELWEQPAPDEQLDVSGWAGWARWQARCRWKAAVVAWGRERGIDYHTLLRAHVMPSYPPRFRDGGDGPQISRGDVD